LFRKITAKSELRKQKQIWRVFGVNYEAEKKKQEEIWQSLPHTPPPPPNSWRLMEKTILKVLIPPEFQREYEEFKRCVYNHLKHRPDFQKFDVKLVERLARIWALWLLFEKRLSLGPAEESARLADGFFKIDSMLSKALDDLNVTPKMRRKVAEDMEGDSEMSEKLKKLIGAK
jgi:hypothetical protein